MLEEVEQLMLEYASILSKIEGGHSGSIIAFDDAIGLIDGKAVGVVSQIPWFDLELTAESNASAEKWEQLAPMDTSTRVMQRMQSAWSFQKAFNTSAWSNVPYVETEMSSIIEKMKNAFDTGQNDILGGQELYVDFGGNDYWMIVVTFSGGRQTFEFLHFID